MDTRDLINSMVEDIYNNSPSSAMEKFEDIIAVKTSDALDNRRMEIASSLYTSPIEEQYKVNDMVKLKDKDQSSQDLGKHFGKVAKVVGVKKATSRSGAKDHQVLKVRVGTDNNLNYMGSEFEVHAKNVMPHVTEEAYDKKAVMKAPGYKSARNKKAIHALLSGRTMPKKEQKPMAKDKKEE